MEKEPIQLDSGKIGCPICQTPLIEGSSPYFIKGMKVGEFDSIFCVMCRYSVLTEKGYVESGKKAEEMGLIGVPEVFPVIKEELTLETPQNVLDHNRTWIPEYDEELEPYEYPEIIFMLEKETIPVLTNPN